jgi:Uma2 family endonuclease
MPARAKLPAMNVPLRKPWTQDQFFSWAETQDVGYEFDGFQPVAMTGGNVGHSRVIRRLHRALDARLRGGPCEPLGPDAGVETVNKAIRYPDALITCSKADGRDRLVPGVVIVFEVLSPTSGRVDRIVKVREYAAVPSIRRYVILESSSVGLMVMERSSTEQVWLTTVLTNDDILRMPEIGIEVPVAEIYEGIEFPDQDSISE